MGVWSEQVVPRVTRLALATPEHRQARQRVCAGLSGQVVEVGFGAGLNVPHYPASVREVVAVEPSDVAWSLSAALRDAAPVPVRRAGLDGQRLPFDDGTFDAALSTWTMCTIPDATQALRELARVLRPGGRLFLVEHGAAPDAGVLRAQRRWDPVQRRLFAGCHVSRPIEQLLADAGWRPDLQRYYAPGTPRLFGSTYEGSATPAR